MTFHRRHLPHWQPPAQEMFITWRLYGSLPGQFRLLRNGNSSGKQFVAYDRILDGAVTGPVWLKNPHIAETVLQALHDAHRQQLFRLESYVLMSNHVHILIEPQARLAEITRQIKGATARQANMILSRTGARFWQDESFDHWVRDAAERQRIREYIERNPVTAGLVARAEDWPWSSASRPPK